MYSFDKNVVLDFRDVQYYPEIHRIIKKALDFPEWYGENWDALWDCLTDIMDEDALTIEILGMDTIRRKFPPVEDMLISIFREWKGYYGGKYADHIHIFIIENGHEMELTAIMDEDTDA
ncbi:MAG: barstar family protein [Clostridia bacterium]|nr:barstar family protein [Clostridia bacterium]